MHVKVALWAGYQLHLRDGESGADRIVVVPRESEVVSRRCGRRTLAASMPHVYPLQHSYSSIPGTALSNDTVAVTRRTAHLLLLHIAHRVVCIAVRSHRAVCRTLIDA